MEVEHVPYIFGSFNRRRQSQHLPPKSTSTTLSSPITPTVSSLPPAAQHTPQSPIRLRPVYQHAKSRSQPEDTRPPLESPTAAVNGNGERAWRTRSCMVQVNAPRKSGRNGQKGRSLASSKCSSGEMSAICAICGKIYLEPRVLSCLHSFCTRCLQEVVNCKRNEDEMWIPSGADSFNASTLTLTPSSLGRPDEAGCLSTFNRLSSTSSHDNQSCSNSESSSESGGYILCPICNRKTSLNRQGVMGLSPNFIIQHRLVLSTLNDENTRLLCDLCAGEVTASHRCSDCLVNMCPMCSELHNRHNNHNHELLTLKEVRQRGLMRIHRSIMCLNHPERDLSTFCCQCSQVVCSECVRTHHASHLCEPASRAAISRIGRIHKSLQRAQMATKRERLFVEKLRNARQTIETKCRRVEKQVEQWIEEYRRTIEDHRSELIKQINRIREDKLSSISSLQYILEEHLQEADTSISFTENLLEEGSDVEVLTFIGTLLKKLDRFEHSSMETASLVKNDVHVNEILNQEDNIRRIKEMHHKDDKEELEEMPVGVVEFLPREGIVNLETRIPMIFGILTEQIVDTNKSSIRLKGLESTRINTETTINIICRDKEDNQMTYGGERLELEIRHTPKQICAERKHCNNDAKDSEEQFTKNNNKTKILDTPQIEDKRDGTYRIKFTPNESGTYVISVGIHGQHILESPVTLLVQDSSKGSLKPCKIIRTHRGVFHCCSWCSSGGKKIDVLLTPSQIWECACGGTIPGGYQGCGHGHAGHPGRSHWSCCGSVQEFGGCQKGIRTSYDNKLGTIQEGKINNVDVIPKINRNSFEGPIKTSSIPKVYHITL